jgi:hypothetical protein
MGWLCAELEFEPNMESPARMTVRKRILKKPLCMIGVFAGRYSCYFNVSTLGREIPATVSIDRVNGVRSAQNLAREKRNDMFP